VHWSTEPISASVELRAVYVWRLAAQSTGPPSQITKPAMERDLKRSRKIGGSSGCGTDWSCGPQLESVRAVRESGSKGNLTKDSSADEDLLENLMPRSAVSMRYRMAYLAESIWPGEHLLLYCAIMLVMVDKSGRVWVESQFREPTYSWRVLLRASRS